MEVLGYAGALLMGLSLGLIGGGGSILTVPILVYLFAMDGMLATSYSLFIVGVTSLIGSLNHLLHGNVQWRSALIFGLPSLVSVYLTRHLIVPLIPETLFVTGSFALTRSVGILVLFAIIMLVAAWSMIHTPRILEKNVTDVSSSSSLLVLLQGLWIGCLTGLIGAGGGFLIVPALVFMVGLTMKQAIGTSLVIIALNALIGFVASLQLDELMDWPFLLLFSGISLVGILIGSRLSIRISGARLKPAFGWFVLVMGCYIIIRELIIHP